MKRTATLLALAVVATSSRGSSSAIAAQPAEQKPGQVISIKLRGEAAEYCYKKTHPQNSKSPSGLEISTCASLGQVLPGGRLRYNASLPANQQGKLLTISFTVSPQDIDKNQNVEVSKARALQIRTWSLQDEFVKE